jgi:hypothetical protein
MSKMEWGELPTPRRSSTGVKYAKLRDELKQRPGKWAMVYEGPRRSSVAVYMGLRRNGCEAHTHTVGGKKDVQVWARWNGETGGG